ncbi:hypothetical protein ACHAWO_002519 [Cyclotella atomus]|uniref:Uncharacterized protein n=1 Tax=Cyclotella atomus TaxID=382360 RepID=A0ABD3N990_9STRA
MITAVRIASSRAVRSAVVPRAVGATRSLAIGDSLASKEKVEEDRYIRAREAQIADSRIAESKARKAAADLAAADKARFAAKSAAMENIANMLARTGDVVSEAGLANLAKFIVCK